MVAASRDRSAALVVWGGATGLAAFVLFAAVAPATSSHDDPAPAAPLWPVLAQIARLLPLGDLPWRLGRLLSMAAGALAGVVDRAAGDVDRARPAAGGRRVGVGAGSARVRCSRPRSRSRATRPRSARDAAAVAALAASLSAAASLRLSGWCSAAR